ncbi:MAG: hypothetical protein Q9P14_18815 [candidate division KSB1 bacterium]|nr:hypothetical protein [candidate division KSB1 bacterium]
MFQTIFWGHPIFQMITDSWKNYFSMGLFLIAMALFIFVFPQIIAYLIASLLLAAGIFMLVLAYRAFRMRKEFSRWFEF